MTDKDLMNYAYWHIWGSCDFALFLGLGVACGLGIQFLYFKYNWRLTLKGMVGGFLLTTILYLIYDYIRFIIIWTDIVINGNV